MNKINLAWLFLSCSFYCQGQTRILEGRVLDEHLNPLFGVTIQTLDSTKSVQTDENGYYSINLPKTTSRIHACYIGMESETFKVRSYCKFNIVLMDFIITEFETPKEHRNRLNERKKNRPALYQKARDNGLIAENEPCS